MTLITILGDGTTLPKLGTNYPLILIRDGSIFFGCLSPEKFRKGEFYLTEPENHHDLKEQVFSYVLEECYDMMFKKHPVHILCPRHLSVKMKWEPAKFAYL